jgi:hypothetical protein
VKEANIATYILSDTPEELALKLIKLTLSAESNDSMIAKIIAYGSNRSEALSRLKRALNP